MNFVETKRIKLAQKCVYYGKYEYAQLIINKLLEEDSTNPELLKEIGILYIGMQNYETACKFIRSSFDKEKSVEILKLLASVNMQCGHYEDAAIQYEELTKHEDTEEIYARCVEAYKQLDIYEESIRIAKIAVEKFKNASTLASLFFIYVVCGMEKESIECCNELKKNYPNNPITYNSLGFLYETIYNDYEEAKKYFLKATKLGFIEAYYNLGVCCKQSEDFVGAEKYLKKLIALKHTSSMDYNYTLGSVYMAQKKLRLGYKYYSNRQSSLQLTYRNRNHLWDGKDYPKETLFVSSEQGFGDNIQFVRYLPFVAKKFKKVIYSAPSILTELFQNSFPQDEYPNIEIIPQGTPIRYNKFALIMDLPYLLHQNFHNIPSKEHYLISNNEKEHLFKEKYFNNDDIKIGLCWRAKGMGIRDAVYRTIDAPYYFKDLFNIENAKYYSFQMGDIFDMNTKYPQITDVTEDISNFDDTAAALKNLDILITIDTALAHLAGALGVKTYLLLCHAPDWRWFDNTTKTEWYPSIKIIKQHDRKTWEDVSKQLVQDIKIDVKKLSKKE